MPGRLDVEIEEIAEGRLIGCISGILKTRFGVTQEFLRDVRIGFSFEDWQQGFALHGFGNGKAGCFEQRWSDVNQLNQRVAPDSLLKPPGP